MEKTNEREREGNLRQVIVGEFARVASGENLLLGLLQLLRGGRESGLQRFDLGGERLDRGERHAELLVELLPWYRRGEEGGGEDSEGREHISCK